MKDKSYFPLYLGVAIVIGILIGSYLNFNNKAGSLFGRSNEEAKIKRLIDYIEYDYVDDVDTEDLLDGAINQIVSKLDPHSVYFTKEELERENEQFQGNFVGIGVQFRLIKDSVVVTRILDGGPSERAGLKAGDRILMASSDSISGIGLDSNDVMGILKGEPDTDILLKVYRRSEDKIIDYPLTRGEVPIKSVPSYYMLSETIGYIKVDRFARTTYDEFKAGLTLLLDKGMEKLVLDLRNNPGGFVNIAIQMADEFLEDNKLIVFTKNKKGDIDEDYATENGAFEEGEVYILINENSASASEIVAGALQDNDRGVIIGRRSFGKGLVQQTMGLGDGSAIRLTISRYYTPTGRSIQKPYNLSESEAYYDSFYKRFENGELMHADSIKVNDSLKFTTPEGKVVYGGGGIVPDTFVAIDTAQYIRRIFVDGIDRFSFNYVDNNRVETQDWTLENFITGFDNDDEILNLYLADLDVNRPISERNLAFIKSSIKASFAQNLFDDNGFYQVIQKDDNMLEKILELENTN